jgi:succinoglycan biosynthesis protein ExoA
VSRVERITVVAAMRNEAATISEVLADLAAQDFAGEIDVLLADGASTDRSAEVARRAAKHLGVPLAIVDNPRRIASTGLNACIERAAGDLVVRLDCHSRYPADYLRRCAEAAEETDAWNVGGIFRAEGCTPTQRAVAAAMDSPFGGVNWTRDSSADGRVEADTVYCGAFRPVAFERAGVFDEELVRNQDDELNIRIRCAGGRIVFDPAITAEYTPRSSYRGVFRQYYEYGLWKVPVMLKHRQVASARSLAPIAFVGSLAALATAAPVSRRARRLLAAEAGAYALSAVVAGAGAVRRRREPIGLLPRTVAVFPAFHLGYGTGMIAGWLRAASSGTSAS